MWYIIQHVLFKTRVLFKPFKSTAPFGTDTWWERNISITCACLVSPWANSIWKQKESKVSSFRLPSPTATEVQNAVNQLNVLRQQEEKGSSRAWWWGWFQIRKKRLHSWHTCGGLRWSLKIVVVNYIQRRIDCCGGRLHLKGHVCSFVLHCIVW